MNKIETYDYLDDFQALEEREPRRKFIPKPKQEWRPEMRVYNTGNREPEKPMSYANDYVHLNEMKSTETGFKSSLISEFIIMKGPEAVAAHIKSQGYMSEAYKSYKAGDIGGKWIGIATGLIFERLAHYTIKNQESRNHLLYLDPGSCTRIFSILKDRNIANYTPDGLGLNISGDIPEIDSILEYKSNPLIDLPTLEQQVTKMNEFLEKYSGNPIGFNYPLTLDMIKNIKTTSVGISKDAKVKLVIPSNRYVPDTLNAEIIRTPFNSSYLRDVTHATMRDIMRIS